MDVFSAPSRILLGYAAATAAALKFWLKNLFEIPFPGVAIWGAILGVVSAPPAFALGWVSRLSTMANTVVIAGARARSPRRS